SRGDLFGEVCSGVNPAGLLNVVVGQKNYFQAITYIRIIIQDLSHRVDQLNDQLRHEVARSSFAAENKGSGHQVDIAVVFDTVVQRDDVQQVQMLPLIFMQAFHLNVEDRFRIHYNIGLVFDVAG